MKNVFLLALFAFAVVSVSCGHNMEETWYLGCFPEDVVSNVAEEYQDEDGNFVENEDDCHEGCWDDWGQPWAGWNETNQMCWCSDPDQLADFIDKKYEEAWQDDTQWDTDEFWVSEDECTNVAVWENWEVLEDWFPRYWHIACVDQATVDEHNLADKGAANDTEECGDLCAQEDLPASMWSDSNCWCTDEASLWFFEENQWDWDGDCSNNEGHVMVNWDSKYEPDWWYTGCVSQDAVDASQNEQFEVKNLEECKSKCINEDDEDWWNGEFTYSQTTKMCACHDWNFYEHINWDDPEALWQPEAACGVNGDRVGFYYDVEELDGKDMDLLQKKYGPQLLRKGNVTKFREHMKKSVDFRAMNKEQSHAYSKNLFAKGITMANPLKFYKKKHLNSQ